MLWKLGYALALWATLRQDFSCDLGTKLFSHWSCLALAGLSLCFVLGQDPLTNSHCAPLQMGTDKLSGKPVKMHGRGNPVMDQHPIQGVRFS